jgi:hypothetical protein
MDSALQVDLAKPEAPANQVLDTSLGEAARHASSPAGSISRERSPSTSKQSIKGGSAATAQVSLKPKSVEQTSDSCIGSGDFEESPNVFVLQPVDNGFGAWSYVASAFAMYIVVWGKLYSSCLF